MVFCDNSSCLDRYPLPEFLIVNEEQDGFSNGYRVPLRDQKPCLSMSNDFG